MLVGPLGGHTTALGTLQKPLLNQEGLVQVLQSATILTDRGGDGRYARRPTLVLLNEDVVFGEIVF